jgi:tRNA dimethylallyltransferase
MGAVWLIAGPTASGKSAYALDLAERLGGEIVNADSMQLYSGMRVITARPSEAEEARAPHHLYGVADPSEAWSVGQWLRAVEPVLADIAARGRTAVVVGGTGLYFRALTEGLADVPPVPEAVRAAEQARLETEGEAAFRERLRSFDAAAEDRIAPGDRQRLVRAAAVHAASGRSLSQWRGETGAPLLAAYEARVIEPERDTLYARCDARFDAMLAGGALEEARAMAARNLSPELPAMKALGLRDLIRHLEGELSLEAAAEEAKLQTRRYAKRQLTWFRNQTPDWPRHRP